MSTLVKFITTLILAAISSFANANERYTHLNEIDNQEVINNYIDLMKNGNFKTAKEIFSNNVKQTITTTDYNYKYDKTQLLKHLKNIENLKMNCTATYKLIDKTNQNLIVRVELEFENFKRIDYLTISYKNKVWEIEEIDTSYN